MPDGRAVSVELGAAHGRGLPRTGAAIPDAYFDATAHAEFLYACVEQTVERDLPEEVRFLRARAKELAALTDTEGERIEELYAEALGA
jgi:hypothetical protein